MNFIWQSAAELDAWTHNAVSRGAELHCCGGTAFIRIRLSSDSFTLRGPDLPADSPPITGARIVYRWQPSDAPHVLNGFWDRRAFRQLSCIVVLWTLRAVSWTAQAGGPISSPGLPSSRGKSISLPSPVSPPESLTFRVSS